LGGSAKVYGNQASLLLRLESDSEYIVIAEWRNVEKSFELYNGTRFSDFSRQENEYGGHQRTKMLILPVKWSFSSLDRKIVRLLFAWMEDVRDEIIMLPH